MSIERTSKKHSRSEDDNHIEFIDIIDIEKLTPDDANNGTLNEHMKNAFDELLNNKEESDSLKSKGSLKLCSWIYTERTILKPYIDIVISSLNVSKDPNSKEDVKRLMKINLTNDEWEIIRDLLEVLGPFAELTEKLEEFNNNLDLETNNHAFKEHQFEEADEDDESGARQKIKINTPVNITGLLDNIKANLYKESCRPKPKKRKILKDIWILKFLNSVVTTAIKQLIRLDYAILLEIKRGITNE
ncbi:hypothetical protein C1646_669191 [Rhizophagus diaphanus]|nr:hypothetical protein C1646_669191 [Rhizophagus diaphanus] [Rhizophagus sp. MUCL 43196]